MFRYQGKEPARSQQLEGRMAHAAADDFSVIRACLTELATTAPKATDRAERQNPKLC
jgi:hypothetical protein